MEHDLYGAQKRIWNMIRKRKKQVNEEVQINNITPEIWIKHFGNLLGQEPTKDNLEMDAPQADSITLEEVQKATQKTKNRNAPGIDNITNETIKYVGLEIQKEITKLFQKIIESGKVPNK